MTPNQHITASEKFLLSAKRYRASSTNFEAGGPALREEWRATAEVLQREALVHATLATAKALVQLGETK